MKHQNNNNVIYKLRQGILSGIRDYAAQITKRPKGTFIIGARPPIVTFETDERVTDVSVTGFIFDEATVSILNLTDIYDHSEYQSYGGENIYIEGLNNILAAIEKQAGTKFKVGDIAQTLKGASVQVSAISDTGDCFYVVGDGWADWVMGTELKPYANPITSSPAQGSLTRRVDLRRK